MIQRKQTLFLLVAFIACVICLFVPVASVMPQGMGNPMSVHCLGISSEEGIRFDASCLPLFLLCSVSALISLATVFQFKNRKLQMNLCSINLLFNVLWYVDYAVIFFGLVGLEKVSGDLTFHWGAVMPLISFVFVLLARKGVSDDEKLVRAADRIR